jgi:hypothetical protein
MHKIHDPPEYAAEKIKEVSLYNKKYRRQKFDEEKERK